MERYLVWSAEDADYVIDLSNIARESSFGGPGDRSLERLRLVLEALVKLTDDPTVHVYLVADKSLRRAQRKFTTSEDVRLLRRWVDRGLVEEVDDADERVLEIAAFTDMPIISGDFYDGYRDRHEWIQRDRRRFLKPVAANPAGDAVRLVARNMGVRPAPVISLHKERDVLKARGLLDQRRRPRYDVLFRSWRCAVPGCSVYDVGKAYGRVLLPRMRNGTPTCEVHGKPLVDGGPRPSAAQIKLLVDGKVVERYTLPDGSETPIGRHPESGIALFDLLDASVAARISREHVVVSFHGGLVRVRDVSSYGSRIRFADQKNNFALGDWTRLDPSAEYRFRPGDEVELTRGVVLARSSKIFPEDTSDARALASPHRRAPLPGEVAETVRA